MDISTKFDKQTNKQTKDRQANKNKKKIKTDKTKQKQTNKQKTRKEKILTKKVADMSTNTNTAPVIRWAGFDHVT